MSSPQPAVQPEGLGMRQAEYAAQAIERFEPGQDLNSEVNVSSVTSAIDSLGRIRRLRRFRRNYGKSGILKQLVSAWTRKQSRWIIDLQTTNRLFQARTAFGGPFRSRENDQYSNDTLNG
jgi:hypothetical protein